MLGSLARKLRALGFEAGYYRSGDDSDLVKGALAEGAVVLTCDRALFSFARSKGADVVLVTGSGDAERLRSVWSSAEESGLRLKRGDPLCSLCGGVLEARKPGEVSGDVPPSVVRRHREFSRCRECGQVYWKGSHWKKLRSLSRRFEQSQHAHVS